MIHTLSLNPMVGIHILALVQTIFFAIYATVPKNAQPRRKMGKRTLSFFRHLGIGALSTAGVLFVDMGLMWFFGGWTLADWRFQLPSVILLIIVGLQYILAAALIKGTVIDLGFIAGVATLFIWVIHISLPANDVMGEFIKDMAPYLFGAPIVVYLAIAAIKAYFIERRMESNEHKRMARFTWDYGEKIKKFYGRKTNLVLWILAVTQSFLAFFGYSILTLF
ncbi:MAG: hypothetical protein ACTSUE_22620 [Promethearchaeota archaeon]